MEAATFLAVLLFLGWQIPSYFNLERERARLLASANENLYNARAAKAKRSELIAQLISIVREFAGHEAAIIDRASSYTSVIGILGSLPTKYPTIGADRHYFSLLSDAARESSLLQQKIETHNSVVSQYNALVTSPLFRLNFLTSGKELKYLGRRIYETISPDEGDLEG